MAASKQIKVPDIGDFADVDIIEILVAPGDRVAADDPLITVESDKASMDIPSPEAGVVATLMVAVGDKVSEGSVIILLESGAEAENDQPPPVSESTPPDAGEPAPAAAVPAAARPESPLVPCAPRQPPVPPAASLDQGSFINAHAAPSVRRYARELGVDLARVSGTGRKTRIVKSDVQAFVKQAMTSRREPATASQGAAIPAIPEVDFSKFGEIDVQPLKRIQKISGAHLRRVWLNVPMVTHHDEADVTELEAFRKSLKAEADKRGVRLTSLTFLMKALASALAEFPGFNASLSADGEQLVYKRYFHIGIAVDTPNGLVVPVFRDVDRKSVFELAAEMGEVSMRARDGKLGPAEMQGGCMSISSLGGIGGQSFTPLVNAPEVAILGVTRARMQPVWNGTEFIPRLMQPLDLTYDHRVVDGAQAARFMVHYCGLLSDLRRLLL